MMDISQQVSNVFDLNSLNSIRQQSNKTNAADKEQALQTAAKQFESIFMQMLLKSMRQAEDVLASDSPFNSQTTRFFRDMHDQQLASEMSNKGSLGLAKLIVKQLGGASDDYTPASMFTHQKINLPSIKQVSEPIDNKAELSTDSNVPNPEISVLKSKAKKENTIFTSAEDFVEKISPYIDVAAKALGVPSPVLVAQAALETGWGQKIIQTNKGESSHNLFNIKADKKWQGDSAHKTTLEFEQGAMIQKREPFRVYNSLAESVDDYINFLQSNERYQNVLQSTNDVEQFLQGLQDAGYATDPNYATKISNIVSKVIGLTSR